MAGTGRFLPNDENAILGPLLALQPTESVLDSHFGG
jgi:hypothetical protein